MFLNQIIINLINLASIKQYNNCIYTACCSFCWFLQIFSKFTFPIINSRSINKNHLIIFAIFNTKNFISCCLRLWTGYCNLFTNNRINKSAFTNIWFTNNSNKSRFKHFYSPYILLYHTLFLALLFLRQENYFCSVFIKFTFYHKICLQFSLLPDSWQHNQHLQYGQTPLNEGCYV